MSQHSFSEKPAEPQKKEDAKAQKYTAERKGVNHKIGRDHRKSYTFCRTRLTKHQLWQKHHATLKQADKLTERDLSQLLHEDPSYRSYASDLNPGHSSIEPLSHCLKEVNLDTNQLEKLMSQGPVAWICLSEIIRCFSRCVDLQLRHPTNICAIIAGIEHLQPLANACMLLTGQDSESEDAANHLGYENFVLIRQAGADAMEVAVSYITLLQQPTFVLDSAVLNLASDALPVQTLLDAQQAQDPAHSEAWLTLFAVLPGLATAHEAIYQCNKLSQQEKLLFLRQAIHLGINIQAISKALDALCLNNSLTGPRLQQLFAFITQDKGQQTFIPNTLAEDIAQADLTDLSNLQKTLAHQRYISSNFIAAKCLGDALVSACLAGILDTALYDTLLRKAKHLTPIMGEALRFLADQPQGGRYTTSCKRVLTKDLFNQVLDTLSLPDKKTSVVPDPQQINQNVLKMVSKVMTGKKAFPALNAKDYPHLYAYQKSNSSRQQLKPSELASSFFSPSSSNLMHPKENHSSSHSNFDLSSTLINEVTENGLESELKETKSRTIVQEPEARLNSGKNFTGGTPSLHQQLIELECDTLSGSNEKTPVTAEKSLEEQLSEAEQEKAINTHSYSVSQ
jgi:hypothetical protein